MSFFLLHHDIHPSSWDKFYERELNNLDEFDDEGEIWYEFDEDFFFF